MLTKEEKKAAKSKSRGAVYQESATEPVRREADQEAGDTQDGADTDTATPTSMIGGAVFKVFRYNLENINVHLLELSRSSGKSSAMSDQVPNVGRNGRQK